MGNSEASSNQQPASPLRPSLIGDSANGHVANVGNDNILDAISSVKSAAKPSHQKKGRAIYWLALLVVPLALFASWAWVLPLVPSPSPSPSPTPAPIAARVPIPPKALAETPSQALQTNPSSAVNISATPSSPQAVIDRQEDTANSPFAALQKPAVAPEKSSPAKKSKPQPLDKNQVVKKAKASKTNDAKNNTSLAKAKPSAAKTKAKSASSSNDADVALINAIMTAINTPSSTTNANPQTIATLVATCKSSDPTDTLNCKRRICEGSWGKAQACPMKLAPKAAKTRAKPNQ